MVKVTESSVSNKWINNVCHSFGKMFKVSSFLWFNKLFRWSQPTLTPSGEQCTTHWIKPELRILFCCNICILSFQEELNLITILLESHSQNSFHYLVVKHSSDFLRWIMTTQKHGCRLLWVCYLIYSCECVCVCYLLSLACDEVPNCLAEERCQEGVKWGWLLQEAI